MDPLWISVIVGSLATLVCYVLLYYKNKYSYWKRKNVFGPKPMLFVGNILQQINGYFNVENTDLEWPKRYGKCYGTYIGSQSRLVITDPEALLQICVKDFDNFTDHGEVSFLNKYQQNFLFLMGGEHWKRTRALMSPTFTSGKIKRMYRFLGACADDLIEAFKEQLESKNKCKNGGVVVDLKETYNLYTMDAITTCCYGLKLERANLTDKKSTARRDEFIKLADAIFKFNVPRMTLSIALPKKLLSFLGFELVPERKVAPLVSRVEQLIEARKKTEKKFDDYLQLLVDARLEDDLELNELDAEENHHAGLTDQSLIEDQKRMAETVKSQTNGHSSSDNSNKAKLTDLEIVAGATFLLVVGLDTTSTLLTHASYALAHHQDLQERLYQEILKIVQYNEDKTKASFDYEAITTCKYLDAVLSETLRRLTPVFTTNRQAIDDYYLEKYKLHLPAGQIIDLNFHGVMNDPDYWEEPEKFNPDRFMPENKDKIVPGSYCPFGLGPRHCIGMRFSLTEAKLAMAKMMINFKFDPAPGTLFPPKLIRRLGLVKLEQPNIVIVPRTL